MSDEQYRRLASEQYGSEGEIEIDEGAVVSRSEEPGEEEEAGAYVAAWVWVERPSNG